MSVLSELKEKGMEVRESKWILGGYYETPKGIVVTKDETKATKKVNFLISQTGRLIPFSKEKAYITSGTRYDGRLKTLKEAQKLAQDGKIYSFVCSNVYEEYYGLEKNPDLKCSVLYGYSHRSRNYIEKVMKDIGLTGYTHADNDFIPVTETGVPTIFHPTDEYDLFTEASAGAQEIRREMWNTEDAFTVVGEVEDGVWIAQTCYQIAIDNFSIVKMYFDHKPSEQEVKTAFAVDEFERHPIEVYQCKKCNGLVNWLDADGTIEEKRQRAEERNCCDG